MLRTVLQLLLLLSHLFLVLKKVLEEMDNFPGHFGLRVYIACNGQGVKSLDCLSLTIRDTWRLLIATTIQYCISPLNLVRDITIILICPLNSTRNIRVVVISPLNLVLAVLSGNRWFYIITALCSSGSNAHNSMMVAEDLPSSSDLMQMTIKKIW